MIFTDIRPEEPPSLVKSKSVRHLGRVTERRRASIETSKPKVSKTDDMETKHKEFSPRTPTALPPLPTTLSKWQNEKQRALRRQSADDSLRHQTSLPESAPPRRRPNNRAKSLDEGSMAMVKYLTNANGVRQLNPDWQAAQEAAQLVLYPFVNRDTALPVVSYPSQENLFELMGEDDDTEEDIQEDDFDHNIEREDTEHKPGNRDRRPDRSYRTSLALIKPTTQYEDALNQYQSDWHMQALHDYENLTALNEYEEIHDAESKELTVQDLQSSSQGKPIGAHGGWDNRIQQELEKILERYEIPGGMLPKLLSLDNFSVAEIWVDDGAPMNLPSDVLKTGSQTEYLTRWEEAKERIIQMMQLVAYLPVVPVFETRFLNRSAVLELKRHPREKPQAYLKRIQEILDNEFAITPDPNNGSPALERLRDSFHRHHRLGTDGVLRYFMTHGVPDGTGQEGDQDGRHKIVHLLMYRAHPDRNPFTFMSCTNEDSNTRWMKEAEEVVPYCSEFDDYIDESEEILRDQGKAFPYSYGLHLCGQLVAAFNPHDLDAMDESVPFSRPTLADLLGYELSDAEYKYYFDSFLEAQQKLWSSLDDYQREFVTKLPELYGGFSQASLASDIVEVRNYRRRLKAHSPNIAMGPAAVHASTNKSPRRMMRLWGEGSLPKLLRENSLTRLFGKNTEEQFPSKKRGKQQKRFST